MNTAAERFSGGFGCVDRGVLFPTATRCGSRRAACWLDLLRCPVVVGSSWRLPPRDAQRLVDPGVLAEVRPLRVVARDDPLDGDRVWN